MIRGVSKVCESVINTEMNLKINKRNRKWNFRPQCYTESIVYLFFVFKKKKEKKSTKAYSLMKNFPFFGLIHENWLHRALCMQKSTSNSSSSLSFPLESVLNLVLYRLGSSFLHVFMLFESIYPFMSCENEHLRS